MIKAQKKLVQKSHELSQYYQNYNIHGNKISYSNILNIDDTKNTENEQNKDNTQTTEIEPFIDVNQAKKLDEKTTEKYEQIVVKILELFEKNKIYKNPELSLNLIANELDINKSYISEAVNYILEKRFNDFVNEYRIKEIIKLFEKKEYQKYSIDVIYPEVGFTTKATFYSYFKRYTGVTPAFYIRNLNKEEF